MFIKFTSGPFHMGSTGQGAPEDEGLPDMCNMMISPDKEVHCHDTIIPPPPNISAALSPVSGGSKGFRLTRQYPCQSEVSSLVVIDYRNRNISRHIEVETAMNSMILL